MNTKIKLEWKQIRNLENEEEIRTDVNHLLEFIDNETAKARKKELKKEIERINKKCNLILTLKNQQMTINRQNIYFMRWSFGHYSASEIRIISKRLKQIQKLQLNTIKHLLKKH